MCLAILGTLSWSPGLLPSLWTYLTPLLISGTLSPWPRHPGPPSPAPTVTTSQSPSIYNLSLTSASQGMYEISVVPINTYGRTNHPSRLFVYLVLEYDCNASTSNVTTNISLLVPGMGEYRVNLASIMLHN